MSSNTNNDQRGFGTFIGVFLPSVLTILGVIMYLRMGWIVGQVGLIPTLIIVTMATAITLITGLSISATATNMKVGVGGAYYMISRSLGLEAGAAIGIPLYLAKVLGVAFYLAGFAESVALLFPALDPKIIAIVALGFIGFVSYVSADLALKTQFFIFIIIAGSLVSFFGSTNVLEDPVGIQAVESSVGFWAVFAIFFPAVTGIEAGLGMSGDLKNPEKSLPLGTLWAILIGYIIYMAIPVALSHRSSDYHLLSNSLVMKDLSLFGPILVAGIWGATLSSALGALLGAPRTLQALAKDNVLPSFLGKGYGLDDEPRLATAISIMIAFVSILLGDLDAIAPVLSMFFLTSYGLLNFSAGLEGMIANPSWRPKFKTKPIISIIGGVLCLAVMFLINSGATIISLVLTALLYMYIQRKGMTAHWGDMRRGILLALARYSIKKLDLLQENTKSWRPNLLVLAGSPTKRWHLVEFANSITHGKGFVTIAAVMSEESVDYSRISQLKMTIEEYLKRKDINALVRVSMGRSLIEGSKALVRDYGIGSIVPNTVVVGDRSKLEDLDPFVEMLVNIYEQKKNIVVVRAGDYPEQISTGGRIDVWWGRERNNAALGLAFGYMMLSDPKQSSYSLELKSITQREEEKTVALDFLTEYRRKSRLDCKVDVYCVPGDRDTVFSGIKEVSKDAKMVFLGLKPPNLIDFKENREKAIKEYAAYYKSIISRTEGFPPLAIVLAAEEVDFTSIFNS
jgi:amino acid transporter